MENTSKGITQIFFFLFFFLKDPNSFVHSPDNNSVLHALSVFFHQQIRGFETQMEKWMGACDCIITKVYLLTVLDSYNVAPFEDFGLFLILLLFCCLVP